MPLRPAKTTLCFVALSCLLVRLAAACDPDADTATSPDAQTDTALPDTGASPPSDEANARRPDAGTDATNDVNVGASDAACDGFVGNNCDNTGHTSGPNPWACLGSGSCDDFCRPQNAVYGGASFRCVSVAADAQFECQCFQP